MEALVRPIGSIETPYKKLNECPRNIEPNGPVCKLVISKDLIDGLYGLSVGQDILILYWFDNVDRNILQKHSKKTGEFSGVFALRSQNRPNPIGAAIVKIESIENESIYVKGLDCLSGTPLLDIKPAKFSEINR